MICGGLWSFALVCGRLGWFAMVCGGFSYSHLPHVTLSTVDLSVQNKTPSGWHKRWTFSDSVDKRPRFVTLSSVASTVSIASN